MVKVFGYSDKDLYELALREGNRRFGSECKHKRVRGGKCLDCLRTVVSRLAQVK